MQKYLEAYDMYSKLMSEEKQLTKIQSLLILVHSINRTNNFICLSDEEQCQYPLNWKTAYDDTYSFTYRNDRNHTILNVRATQRGSKLQIIFSQVGSSQSCRSIESNAKKYDFTLQQYIKESQNKGKRVEIKKESNRNNYNPPQQPQQSQGGYSHSLLADNVGYPPKNLVNSPNYTNNPFGQEQYVGPNSQIFTNPYQNQQPYPGSLRIPPGARYDKVDPFDNPYQDNRNNPNNPQDFFGFDEFGRPKNSPFTGGNRGGMNNFGGRGGFGGGFGGRGGFGDHFGI